MQGVRHINPSRIFILINLIILLLLLFTGRLLYLQVLKSTSFKSRAVQNQTRDLYIPSYRSIIYDRNKELQLAYNQRSLVLTVIDANLPKTNTIERINQFKEMAHILNTSPEAICTMIKTQYIDPYTPIILQDNISLDIINQFAEKIDEFPGVFWDNRPKRVYPYQEAAFHIIGYTGLLNKEEYRTNTTKEEYYMGTHIGKGGIEKYYDQDIRGKSGVLVRTVNARGQVLQQDMVKEPIQGEHLVLTIDARLQQKTYELMKDFVGAAIITHANTGEILSLVSTPSIDPSIFYDSTRTQHEFPALVLNDTHPFLNRAIQGKYPPASTFKIISTAAFLKDGLDPNFKLQTTGSYAIGDRVFRDWKNHGIVDTRKALEVSANVYFYHNSLNVGRQNIFQMAREFGLTMPYQIDLPDERPGFLPNDQWFRQVHKRQWSHGDTANISIGQGDVITTPLEINMMTTVIANRGIIYKPYILKERLRIRDKKTVWQQEKQPLKIVNMPEEHFQIIQEGMRNVIVGNNGTATWLSRYNMIRVPIAGKTGTAQTGSKAADNGLFTAFGPYHPKQNSSDTIVITILLEKARTGNAVRIAADLFNYYFEELYPEKNPNPNFRRSRT
ncbi:MAG: penicillin-binding protein 2 [Brevinema sp.]